MIMLLVHGETTLAVPFYGVGVFMPIMVMGLAIRQHILRHYTGRARAPGARPAPRSRRYWPHSCSSARSWASGQKAAGWC